MTDFFLGKSATIVVMVKFDDIPFSGATVTGDYFKPDNNVYLVDQLFTEINTEGVYCHTFDIAVDDDVGIYKVKIEAVKGLASDTFVDIFTEADGPASNWIPAGGNWEIQNNVYKQIYQQDLPFFSAAGNSAWQDITYEVDVRADSGGYVGIAFKYNDIENAYLFYLRIGSNNVRLAKAPFVTLAQTPTGSLSLSSGVWYRLKVIMTEANIKLYVDDVLQIEYDDANPIEAGKIGLWCYWTACSFDNINAEIPGVQIKTYAVKDFRIMKEMPAMTLGQFLAIK